MSLQIGLKPFNSLVFYKNRIFSINNGHNIFYGLDKYFRKNEKMSLSTIDVEHKPDVIIFADLPYPWRIDLWLKVIFGAAKKVLYVFESPLVNPFNQMSFLFYFFDSVYTWNDIDVMKSNANKFYIPVVTSKNVKEVNFRDKKFISLVSANKNVPFIFKLASKYRKDLYIERKKAINFFQRLIPDDFDLYGKGWEGQLSYRGLIKEDGKLSTIAKYKYYLCFENAVADGYITEKIFDCFKAKTIPIYWGAPNVRKYIPYDCFIDMRDFGNYTDLYRYLTSLTEKKYGAMIKQGERFLSSKHYKKWSKAYFIDNIKKEINHV